MLEDFYITRLSNDMKIAVQKNHLGGKILYKSLVPLKNDVIILKFVEQHPRELCTKFRQVNYLCERRALYDFKA